jgi:CTP:molybdopterin cytidylyltransferase MocA
VYDRLVIPAVVLAAGASTRMGRPKSLLPIGAPAEPFVARIARTLLAGGADDVVIVVGAHAPEVCDAIRSAGVCARVVENPQWARGQLSSLVAALDLVDRPGVRAILVMPVDMPLVTPDSVRAVLDAYRRHAHPVVRPFDGRRHGHPVLFDRELFGALRAADPARGARAVIAAHLEAVLDVPVADEGAYQDIDTPEDFERFVAGLTGR